MQWPILEGLSAEDVRRVLAAARRRKFARGEVIFHDGDPADTILLIEKGRVAVRVTTPLGHTATLAVFGPGDVFGELALVAGGGSRSATAVALETTETLAIHQDAFDSLQAEHPTVTEVLVHLLADKVRTFNTMLLEALYVPADTRVLRRLVAVAGMYAEDGSTAVVPLTQEDLAGLAGTTRATVNRVLRAEEKRGTVALARGRITVTDREALSRRAR
jgi:CRP-like cAMP-binding protein